MELFKHITDKKIETESLLAEAYHQAAGAVVLFLGNIRNHHLGDAVDQVHYEAHLKMADISIATILAEAQQKWELHYAHSVHRVGTLTVTETAVIVLTACSHRQQSYEANRYIIDRIKKESPIWKREALQDGSQRWSEGNV